MVDLTPLFTDYIGKHDDLKNLETVIQGVKDFIAENISEIAEIRKRYQALDFENAKFKSEVRDDFKDKN